MNCLLGTSRRLLHLCKYAGAVRRSPVPLPLSVSRPYCSTSHGSPVARYDRWYHEPRKVAAAAALALGAVTTAVLDRFCEVVPYTNRTHLVFISPESDHRRFESRFMAEKKIWASHSMIVDPLHPDSVRVRRIAEKIIGAAHRTLGSKSNSNHDGSRRKPQISHLEGIKWEVILLEHHVNSNAFSVPPGKIVVYTGLLDELKNDAEIAFAIAHEVGHLVARHMAEVSDLLPGPLWLPFNRRTELEADHIGTLLLGAAGFHPNAGVLFFQKRAMSDEQPTVFEHLPFPSYKTRIEYLLQPKIMEEAMHLYREATANEGTSSLATSEGFSFPQTLGDVCKVISSRLRQVLRGGATDWNAQFV